MRKWNRKQSNYTRSLPCTSSVPRADRDLSDTETDSILENDGGNDNYEEVFFDVDSGSYNGPRSIKTASKASLSVSAVIQAQFRLTKRKIDVKTIIFGLESSQHNEK